MQWSSSCLRVVHGTTTNDTSLSVCISSRIVSVIQVSTEVWNKHKSGFFNRILEVSLEVEDKILLPHPNLDMHMIQINCNWRHLECMLNYRWLGRPKKDSNGIWAQHVNHDNNWVYHDFSWSLPISDVLIKSMKSDLWKIIPRIIRFTRH